MLLGNKPTGRPDFCSHSERAKKCCFCLLPLALLRLAAHSVLRGVPQGIRQSLMPLTPTNPAAPSSSAASAPRRSLRADLTLALMPTLTVLIVFALVEAWSRQRLLFASLASSAFLIYLDPEHETNSVRTLVLAQSFAACLGFAAHAFLGPTFWAAGGAMVVVIFGMILARACTLRRLRRRCRLRWGPERAGAWRCSACVWV